jgi:hypothetical protein
MEGHAPITKDSKMPTSSNKVSVAAARASQPKI